MTSNQADSISDETIDLFVDHEENKTDQEKANELGVTLSYYRMEFQ